MKIKNSRTNNLIQVDPISRRMFLKSSGGLAMALPFLSSALFSDNANAASNIPLRYVQIWSPHGGLSHANWIGPNLPSTSYTANGETARVDAISKLAGTSGLSPVFGSNFTNILPMMNLIMGADQIRYFGHNRIIGTGAFCVNHKDLPMPADQYELVGIVGEMPSIDQVLAYAGGNGIYTGGLSSNQRRCMNVSVDGFTSSWGRAKYTDTSQSVLALDTIGSTSGVFSTLFGSVAAGSTSSSISSVSATNPLLNLVNEFWPSGKSLMNQLSSNDRKLVDQLFQMASDAAASFSASSAPPLQSSVTCSTTQPANTNSGWGTSGAGMAALADIISMAFKCDLTRVVSIALGDSLVSNDWHAAAHAGNDASAQAILLQNHQLIANNLVARLGNNLNVADPYDSSGQTTALNNSLIYWTHENKCAHDNVSTPTMLLGAAGGRITTGQVADFRNLNAKISSWGNSSPDSGGDLLLRGEYINRLWVSIFYAMGINKSNYEISRGGGGLSPVLSTGYGHVLTDDAKSFSIPYSMTNFASPFGHLTKSSTVWG